jgi:hypothetical protein
MAIKSSNAFCLEVAKRPGEMDQLICGSNKTVTFYWGSKKGGKWKCQLLEQIPKSPYQEKFSNCSEKANQA